VVFPDPPLPRKVTSLVDRALSLSSEEDTALTKPRPRLLPQALRVAFGVETVKGQAGSAVRREEDEKDSAIVELCFCRKVWTFSA